MTQKIRGFIYFENKSLEEIKKKTDFVELFLSYFDKLERNNNKFDMSGIFIDGEATDKVVVGELIKDMRKSLGLDPELKQCDVSSEGDGDKLVYIKNGEVNGNYVGIRIQSELTRDVEVLAKEIGALLEAKNILVRDVEKEGGPKVCIDIITDKAFRDYQKQVEQKVQARGLKVLADQYTFIIIK